jgi:hypothetical protein
MNKNIFEILDAAGFATRPSPAEFLDNWDRKFVVAAEGDAVIITVKGSIQNKLPKLEGMFVFNMKDRATNASAEEVEEIRKILEIKPFDRAA